MFSPFSNGARASHRAQVLAISEVTSRHFRLRLAAPALARAAAPGQFIHVLSALNAAENPAIVPSDPLLRRAFSIMKVDDENLEFVEVLFRVEGRGTSILASAREGDIVDILGPLGKPFDVTPFVNPPNNDLVFHVKQPQAVVVGGGVGVPPLIYLSVALGHAKIAVSALLGAKSKQELIGISDLQNAGARVQVATDDGSAGHPGRVTELLEKELLQLAQRDIVPVVYACGPWPMLRAVAQLCLQSQVRCQVSLEEAMPCGIGVCNGCVVRAHQSELSDEIERNEASHYARYRRICVEGPACWADEIEWDLN